MNTYQFIYWILFIRLHIVETARNGNTLSKTKLTDWLYIRIRSFSMSICRAYF